jgi:hypothetical protein
MFGVGASTVIGSGSCLHLLLLLHHDEGIHTVLLNVLLIVSLQLCYVWMLLCTLDLAGDWVVEVAHVVFFGLQFLELPFDL